MPLAAPVIAVILFVRLNMIVFYKVRLKDIQNLFLKQLVSYFTVDGFETAGRAIHESKENIFCINSHFSPGAATGNGC